MTTRRNTVIWKFPLRPGSAFLDIPEGAEILSCGVQQPYADQQEAVVWAMCDPDAPKIPRYVSVFATGQRIPDPAERFIGTFQIDSGLVFHVFEGGKPRSS